MRVLITGARGQLGRALEAGLSEHDVTACDRRRLDVTDAEETKRTLEEVRPALVINAAAYTDVDGAESDAAAAYRVNSDGPGQLAAATASLGMPLLHVSTDYVFDGRQSRPYTERDPTGPRTVYGASKLAGEESVRKNNPHHYIVRTAWLYHTVGENFPRTMISLASRGEVRVVDDQHGSPTFAPHLVDGIRRLIETEAWGTYHIAGSGGTTWFDLARTLYRLLGIEVVVRPITTAEFPRPAERPRYSVLATIHKPGIVLPPWEEGLAEFARSL